MAPPEQSRGFIPIIPNPFLTGNPVRDPNLFFGREEDFAFARQRLVAESEGGVMLFVGERRSGKTSILFQILNGRLGDEFLPVFIDMQALAGVVGEQEFFTRLAELTCEQVQDDRIAAENYDFFQGNPVRVGNRLFDDIHQVLPERRLVFLVDEAEILCSKVESGELSGNILIYLASILESRRISFFFTGSRGLGEFQGEQWRRLISKATYRVISFLSREDALRLIQKPVEGRVFYSENVVEAIYRLTSGHPYYTQVICTNVVDYLNSVQRNTLVMEDLGEIIQTIIDNPPPSIIYTWDELTQPEQMTLSLLSEESEDERTFLSAEALAEAIEENSYPLDMAADTLHGLMEALYQREVLERDAAGAYRFRVYLLCLWIRRARSIWRLVEEGGPGKTRRVFRVGVGLMVLALAVGTGLWVQGMFEKDQQTVRMGNLWVESSPGDVEVLVNGRVEHRGTPVMIQDLQAGTYAIEVRRAGYHAWTDSVEVQAGRTELLRAHLQRITGFLAVASQPAGAQVRVHGVVDTGGITPLQGLELPVGAYNVSISKDGYVGRQRSVTLTRATEIALAFDLPARVGGLYIVSTPEGAALFLGGREVGLKTPAWLNNLPVGPCRLGLELEDHRRLDTTLNVTLNSTDTISLGLELLPATLELTSNPPGAAIYIDDADTAVAVTPYELTLEPGRHQIRLQLKGYEPHGWKHDFLPADHYRPSITLDPQYGWVRIIRPQFGTVIIDGTARKVPPNTIRLQVGDHTLKTRGKPEGRRVRVSKDDTIFVKVP